jgi:hypothetical protein
MNPYDGMTSVNLDRIVMALRRFAHNEGWDFDHAVFQLERIETFAGGLRYSIVCIPPKHAETEEQP